MTTLFFLSGKKAIIAEHENKKRVSIKVCRKTSEVIAYYNNKTKEEAMDILLELSKKDN